MRTFAQRESQPKKHASTGPAHSNQASASVHRRADRMQYLQPTNGNQVEQPMLATEEPKTGFAGSASARLGHDFSRIAIHPPAAGAIKRKWGSHNRNAELEPEAIAAEETSSAFNFSQVALGHQFDFARVRISAPPIQRKPASSSSGESTPEAAERVAGEPNPHPHQSSHRLPFLDIIQRSFGRHDISHIQAHTGSDAARRALAMGAEAFAQGPEVTFLGTPSLHTTAHEAAHVIQQHAGVQHPGGLGREGDAYERHADEVADRVARGQSSEALLDATPGARGLGQSIEPGFEASPATSSRSAVVQMRRIPPNIRALLTAVTGTDGANFGANAEGAQRLIDRAMAELTLMEKNMVEQRRLLGTTEAGFNLLPLREQLSRQAEAIILVRGLTIQLGDPALIDTGPRAGTSDAANITKVVDKANTIFADIASGARDGWIKDVFGAANVGAVKAKYARGRAAMNRLHGTNSIVTDRSGYSEEASQGGLTDPPGGTNQKIRVEKKVIDSFEGPDPTDPAALAKRKEDQNQSVVTLIHESMHAGSKDIKDDLYTDAPAFTTQKPSEKLHNSAHFEVVPWRILEPTNDAAFALDLAATPPTFQVFIPAGTTVGGHTAPHRTQAEEGTKAAYEFFDRAWSLGLNLHLEYLQLFRKPTDWTVPQFGGTVRFNNSIPFWSKVQKLTIHQKTDIDPASTDEAKHPVSQIDLALSEGLTRKLSNAMDLLNPLKAEADTLAFEQAHATDDERAAAFPGDAHTNANTERDFLMKLVVRNPEVAPMTGPVDRDLRVVRQQGAKGLENFDDILRPRNPSSFPD
jgi:hypothetical protein